MCWLLQHDLSPREVKRNINCFYARCFAVFFFSFTDIEMPGLRSRLDNRGCRQDPLSSVSKHLVEFLHKAIIKIVYSCVWIAMSLDIKQSYQINDKAVRMLGTRGSDHPAGATVWNTYKKKSRTNSGLPHLHQKWLLSPQYQLSTTRREFYIYLGIRREWRLSGHRYKVTKIKRERGILNKLWNRRISAWPKRPTMSSDSTKVLFQNQQIQITSTRVLSLPLGTSSAVVVVRSLLTTIPTVASLIVLIMKY